MAYKVFVCNWWKNNRSWPNGQHTIATTNTEEEAREIAQEYNRTHEPGRLSRKAEYRRI